MSCERAAEFFASDAASSGAAPPELQAHLDTCPHCARMWALTSPDATAGVKGEVASETVAAIAAQLGQGLSPVKPMPGRSILALGFLSIFGLVSTAVIAYLGMTGALMMTWLQLAGVLAAILVGAGMLAVTLSGEMAPGDPQRAPLSTQTWFIALTLVVLAAVLFPWEFSEGWLGGSWHCFQAGFAFSLPAAGLALALLGRGSVMSWSSVGAGAGLLAGLVGATALHLGCPMHTAPHVTLGHMAIPALGGAIGWCFGKIMPALMPANHVSH